MAAWLLDLEKDLDELDGHSSSVKNGSSHANIWIFFPNSSNISSGKNGSLILYQFEQLDVILNDISLKIISYN